MATEYELRKQVAEFLVPYKGIKEGSSAHKELINLFNNSGLCTRYKMTTSDAWCAMATSDAFIGTGLTSIFPCVECGCDNMRALAKTAGIWQENDAYVPSQGDVILYDWQDSGSGDNTGTPDHVGVVYSISGSSFQVIEGNMNDSSLGYDTVGYRSMSVNGKYIRGFITPNYASLASTSEGWVHDSTGWWWRNADGTWPAKQWKLVNHHWYYFGSNGYMKTGWQYINGEWFYLEESGEYEGACWHEKANGVGALERWYVD